jgi:hypothetical protein
MYQPFAPIDYYDALALGKVPKHSRASAVGNNPDVDTATFPEDAWSGGGLYPWLSDGINTALQIRSTSASDTMAVSTFGLTAPIFRAVTVTNTLSGITPVPLGTSLTRINQVMPATMNVGDIIVEDVAPPNTIRAIVPAGIGISQQAAYTVPEGCTLLIRQIYIGMLPASGATARQATVRTYFKFPSGATRLTVSLQMANGQSYAHLIEPPIALTVGTDFNLRIDNVSDNNSNVTCAWNGVLVQN